MINIKVYTNGYEIIGHAERKICHEVSFWYWISSNLITGTDNDAKCDSKHGYSWLIFTPHKYNLDWIFEDFIVSAEVWAKDEWQGQVAIEKVNEMLEKGQCNNMGKS